MSRVRAQSRFYGSASSEESSEEESERSDEEFEESDSDDDSDAGPGDRSRFLVGSDSEEEDEKREIKSGKVKRFEAMVDTSHKLRNHMKINDWISILTDYENLNLQLEKHMKRDIVSRKKPTVPDVFIGSLVIIQDFLTKTKDNKASLKLSKTNTKAFNAVKQRTRKDFKEHEPAMQKFRDEERSLDDDDVIMPLEEADGSRPKGADADDDNDGFEAEEKAAKTELTLEEMNEDQLNVRLREVLATRGRKGTDKEEHVNHIKELLAGAKSAKQKAEILLAVISAQFDIMAPGTAHMLPSAWRDAVSNMRELLKISRENPTTIEYEEAGEAEVLLMEKAQTLIIGDEDEEEENLIKKTEAKQTADGAENASMKLRGDLATLVEGLDDELFRAWQDTDAYGQAYVELLKDERPLLDLMADAQDFFESMLDDRSRAARIASRRILHIYYKSDELLQQIKELNKASSDEPGLPEKSLQELAVLVYRYGEERAKSQTMLCHIYNHALGNRYYEARDMLLLSHLQESIHMLDISLQVLFNRTMAQIGLCAFRLGMPYECHMALQELCTASYTGSGGGAIRLRELLAQGMIQVRGYDKTAEQERAEKKRQIPYHMHLSLDLIDTAHLVSAMLLELPNIALSRLRGDTGNKRRVISRTFQYYLRTSAKQAFSGPAENTRDHVMSASRCLMSCDWRKAYEIIASIRAWQSLEAGTMQSTLTKVKDLVKVEGMRTFVLTYSSFYNSLSTERLSATFELEPSKVHSVISKMIINEELRASWDQPTASVIIRRTEPTRLQSLGVNVAQKCLSTLEHNEKLIEARSGGLSGRGDERDDGRDWNNRDRNNRGRGGRGRYQGQSGGRYGRDYQRDDRNRDGGRFERNYTLLLNKQA
ncbi:hypothetical protein NDN08_006873 [Rhodosorus marinus]|uniref:Eukaryotic translation initiation factor 3 subunit C n=1 Tax=Rhodosorus marinus TaxID=101924 RepID=A0AAV8UKC5_9RHOD|nr:hypothetical protein NDN08_006873 [Rhodosorus marinus]